MQAGADADISALPEGYQTLLGPAFIDGTDLSLSQWQPLAIARTFFRDAPLVILAEPTAALDAKAEHELFSKTGEQFHGRSVLLISHRFSTVRSADRIYVLRDGSVADSGTHAADGPGRHLRRTVYAAGVAVPVTAPAIKGVRRARYHGRPCEPALLLNRRRARLRCHPPDEQN